ncbi:hypothetical protein CCHR01_00474 [Colletotrichum chrysophilum]|uniref:DUF6594 domain-containing protein n=1 Tax=Colletotrichum chrysophilum TaxID=1836956 RepID=A0AAD9B0D2_9PEZI|nr:hypothetical protein CCHR01_00474 [Colletotrichum chrysophilum]
MASTGAEEQVLSQNDLDEKPWKYVGYKDFAKFSALSDDYFAVRRFDELHNRTLLALQDRLTDLEDKLNSLDGRLSERQSPDVDNGSFRKDQPERRELLDQIHDALIRYAQDAPPIAIRNMKRWLTNMNHPIEPHEVEFLNQKDLISMIGQKKSTAQRFLETNIELPFIGWLRRQAHPSRERTAHDLAIHYDAGRLRVMHRVGIYVVALVMLVGPLWLLAALDKEWHKLISISLLLLVFLTVMNWGIVARPFEVLAATAGYSAVLVVFLQMGSEPT